MVTIMKKLFNISYIALFAVLALFSACTESEEYTPGPQPSVENNGYRFNVDINSDMVLNLSDTIFVIEVERDSIANEETLELSVKADSIFEIPTSVTFAAGAAKAQLVIGCSKLEPFVSYAIDEIKLVDESLVNPYLQTLPVLSLNVYKEDYVVKAKGIYTLPAAVFGPGARALAYLEYSEFLDTYRLDGWSSGCPFTFQVTDPETMAFEMTDEYYLTGYTASGYSIYARVAEDENNKNYFDADSNTFYFLFQWCVPSISYNFNEPSYEPYQITEYYE